MIRFWRLFHQRFGRTCALAGQRLSAGSPRVHNGTRAHVPNIIADAVAECWEYEPADWVTNDDGPPTMPDLNSVPWKDIQKRVHDKNQKSTHASIDARTAPVD